MSLPIIGYLDPAFFELLDELSGMLAEIFKTTQRAFAVAGAGSAGMEAGLVSLAQPGDTVIIRAHMSVGGYGGTVMRGTVSDGFTAAEVPPDFASDLETQVPLPTDCAF